jgi:hypothetical protein
MFICDDCINNYYIDGDLTRLLYASRSHGLCEDCKRSKDCYDIPSGNYAHKGSVFGEQYAKRGRKTIGEIREGTHELIFNPSKRVV